MCRVLEALYVCLVCVAPTCCRTYCRVVETRTYCVQSLYVLPVFETYCFSSKPTVSLRKPNALSVFSTQTYCLWSKLVGTEFETGTVCVLLVGRDISGSPRQAKTLNARPRPSNAQVRWNQLNSRHRRPPDASITPTPAMTTLQNTHQSTTQSTNHREAVSPLARRDPSSHREAVHTPDRGSTNHRQAVNPLGRITQPITERQSVHSREANRLGHPLRGSQSVLSHKQTPRRSDYGCTAPFYLGL